MAAAANPPPTDTEETRRCRKCFYQIQGLDEPRCPECGKTFDPEDPKSYTTLTWVEHRERVLLWILAIGVLVLCLSAVFVPARKAYLRHREVGVLRAAQEGDWGKVKRRIRAGYNIHGSNHDGEQPLHFAAEAGELEVVEMLLDAGANVNIASGYRLTPLYMAAANGNADVVRSLLAAGSQLDDHDRLGRRPLERAAEGGHLETVQILIAAGFAPESDYGDGWQSALHFAAKNGHADVVEYLLLQGACVDVEGADYSDTGLRAVTIGKKLLAGARRIDRDSTTPLELASEQGHIEVMKLLIAAGARVGIRDTFRGSPLHWAAAGGHPEAVELLLAEGADVNAVDRQGATPLHWAAYFGQVETVGQLLKLGADPNVRGEVDVIRKTGFGSHKTHGTPLQAATYMGHIDVVKVLMDAGADTSAQNENGLTPSEVAGAEGNEDVVELLSAD